MPCKYESLLDKLDFWTVCFIALGETTALPSAVVSDHQPDSSLDLAASAAGAKGAGTQSWGQVARALQRSVRSAQAAVPSHLMMWRWEFSPQMGRCPYP